MAAALREIVRAQRQVANAFDTLRSAPVEEHGAAMIALEHAHVKLDAALADFYAATEDAAESVSEGDAGADALRLRRLHAAVEALERRAAQAAAAAETEAPGPSVAETAPGAAASNADVAGGGSARAGAAGGAAAGAPSGRAPRWTGAVPSESVEELARLIEAFARELAQVRSAVSSLEGRNVAERIGDVRLDAVEDRMTATETRLRILERYVTRS
jgi:hypothetical protein